MTYRETTPETLYEETELRQIKKRLDDRLLAGSSVAEQRVAPVVPRSLRGVDGGSIPPRHSEKFRRAKRAVHKRREAGRK